MDRDERIAALRREITSRTPDIDRLPPGDPTREFLRSECHRFTEEIEWLQQQGDPVNWGTRLFGLLIAATGLYGAVQFDGWARWASVAVTLLGALIAYGA